MAMAHNSLSPSPSLFRVHCYVSCYLIAISINGELITVNLINRLNIKQEQTITLHSITSMSKVKRTCVCQQCRDITTDLPLLWRRF